jgi:hypothetical protein
VTPLGTLDCPVAAPWPGWPDPGPTTPFSLAVDRSDRAWVHWTSGEIFLVDLMTFDCTTTDYVAGDRGLELGRMTFVADLPRGLTETLYAVGGDWAGLDDAVPWLYRIDPDSAAVTPLAELVDAERWPEIAGTGDAELWAYYPGGLPYVVRLEPSTGVVRERFTLPVPTAETQYRALAPWGGRLYLFQTLVDVSGGSETRQVQRLDPSTGAVEVVVEDFAHRVVAAAASTCAPTSE